MNKLSNEKVIELAKQAGLGRETPDDYGIAVWSANPTSLQRFAQLVRNETLEWAAVLCDDCYQEQIRSLKS